jgi:hypothetical protein
MLKYPDKWVFVSLYDGLGGPPIFCGQLVDQRRVDRAVGSGGCRLYLDKSCRAHTLHIYANQKSEILSSVCL